MTELQRVKIALKALISLGVARNQEEVGKLLGYSNKSSFSQVINGIVNLPADFVERLCRLHSDISEDWIKTGNGDVLLKTPDTNQSYNGNYNYKIINGTNINLSTHTLPLIPPEAMVEYDTEKKETIMHNAIQFLIPTFTRADYLIAVIGDSMYPNYNHGDIVACKHLNLDTFFQWNKVYVINTEQGILIKRILKSYNDDFITIVSDNKECASFELPKSKILSIAIVTGYIREQ